MACNASFAWLLASKRPLGVVEMAPINFYIGIIDTLNCLRSGVPKGKFMRAIGNAWPVPGVEGNRENPAWCAWCELAFSFLRPSLDRPSLLVAVAAAAAGCCCCCCCLGVVGEGGIHEFFEHQRFNFLKSITDFDYGTKNASTPDLFKASCCFSSRVLPPRDFQPRECPTRASPTRVSRKSDPQECPARVSRKSVPQEFPTRVTHKSVLQECPKRGPRKSFLQE